MGGAILPPCYLFSLKQPNRGDYRLNSLPNGRVHGYLQRRLMPRYISQNCCCQCPCPWGRQLSTHGSTGDPQTQVGLAQSPVGSLLLSPASCHTQYFVFALQMWSLCFSQSSESPKIKSHWPSKSKSLGILSPFAGSWSYEAWWEPAPVLVPGKSNGQRSLVGYSLWGRKESDMPERLHCHCVAYNLHNSERTS